MVALTARPANARRAIALGAGMIWPGVLSDPPSSKPLNRTRKSVGPPMNDLALSPAAPALVIANVNTPLAPTAKPGFGLPPPRNVASSPAPPS